MCDNLKAFLRSHHEATTNLVRGFIKPQPVLSHRRQEDTAATSILPKTHPSSKAIVKQSRAVHGRAPLQTQPKRNSVRRSSSPALPQRPLPHTADPADACSADILWIPQNALRMLARPPVRRVQPRVVWRDDVVSEVLGPLGGRGWRAAGCGHAVCGGHALRRGRLCHCMRRVLPEEGCGLWRLQKCAELKLRGYVECSDINITRDCRSRSLTAGDGSALLSVFSRAAVVVRCMASRVGRPHPLDVSSVF